MTDHYLKLVNTAWRQQVNVGIWRLDNIANHQLLQKQFHHFFLTFYPTWIVDHKISARYHETFLHS